MVCTGGLKVLACDLKPTGGGGRIRVRKGTTTAPKLDVGDDDVARNNPGRLIDGQRLVVGIRRASRNVSHGRDTALLDGRTDYDRRA